MVHCLEKSKGREKLISVSVMELPILVPAGAILFKLGLAGLRDMETLILLSKKLDTWNRRSDDMFIRHEDENTIEGIEKG